MEFLRKLRNNPLLRNSLFAVLGSGFAKTAVLFSGILVAKMLGAADFGGYNMIKNFVYSLAIFSTFGLGYTATKFIAENNANPAVYRAIMRNCNLITMFISGILSVLILLFPHSVSIHLFKREDYWIATMLMAFWIFFQAIVTLQNAYLAGLDKFGFIAKINIISGILTISLSVVLTYYYNLDGAVAALLLVQFFTAFVNYIFLRKGKETTLRTETAGKHYNIFSMLKFNWPIALYDLSIAVFTSAFSYLMVLWYGYEELGNFSAAMQWFYIIIFIPNILRNVLLSALSSGNNSGTMKKVVVMNMVITILISALIIGFYPLIMRFYGNTYYSGRLIISLLSVAAVCTGIINILLQSFISSGNNVIILVQRILADAGCIFIFFLLSHWKKEWPGSINLSIGFFISNLLLLLITVISYKRYIVANENRTN